MTIGSSIFLIVIGAILRYAVTWRIHGLNLPALGLILAIAGIITLVIRLAWLFNPGLGERRPPPDLPAEFGRWPAGHPSAPCPHPGTGPSATGPDHPSPTDWRR
ncbi:hypothetical protein [Frankia nepalensis]|uniref:hypothetical protein n=1 Tax=Frankia nepalensis TaxID=1836974 RepID=UPI0027DD5E00|nr:hypothetical protein [Frankia nepalensis]